MNSKLTTAYSVYLSLTLLLFLFFADEKTFSQAKSRINGIELTSACSDDPGGERCWELKNPNTFEVSVHYQVTPGGEEGDVLLPAAGGGDARCDGSDATRQYTYIYTRTRSGTNTLKVTYGSHQQLQCVSEGRKCERGRDKWATWLLNGNNADANDVLGTKNNQPLRMITRDTLRMEIKNNGDVQINNNAVVNGKLDVNTINGTSLSLNTGNTPRLFINPAGDAFFNTNTTVSGILHAHTLNSHGDLFFRTNNLPRLTIYGDGTVHAQNNMTVNGTLQVKGLGGTQEGIVVADAGGNLIKKNTADSMVINNLQIGNAVMGKATVTKSLQVGGHSLHLTGAPLYDAPENSLFADNTLYVQSQAGNSSHTVMNYNNSGNVGIGLNNPVDKLQVSGNVRADGFLLTDGTPLTPGVNLWTQGPGNTIYRTAGNVGIGNTSPQYTLDISGNMNLTGDLLHNGRKVSLREELTQADIEQWEMTPSAGSVLGGYLPIHVIDGIKGTYWTSDEKTSEWFIIGLDGSEGLDLNRVMISTNNKADFGQNVELLYQAPGNSNWVSLGSTTANSNSILFSFNQVRCSAIKIILSNLVPVRYTIDEIQLFYEANVQYGDWKKFDRTDDIYYKDGAIAIGTEHEYSSSFTIYNDNLKSSAKVSNYSNLSDKYGIWVKTANGTGAEYGIYSEVGNENSANMKYGIYSKINGSNAYGFYTSVGPNSYGVFSRALGANSYAGYFEGRGYFSSDVIINGKLQTNGGISFQGLSIDGEQNVGIGTDEPKTKLDIRGSTYIPFGQSYWIGSTTDAGNRLRMHHDGTNAMIDYSRNLYFR